ncbi:MAG TPA: SDR family NAD(P)-dependent oxidoreductase [Mycobacteriales bacterium]|nr:SDR family NAD(P)-dependent oxidoreductase [Mycobacteriales bacterium]
MSDEPQVALVTGASAGVGAAAVHELARRGWRVIATGRSQAKLDAVARSVHQRTGVGIECHQADFARLADVRRLAERVADRHRRLDVLANNAGLLAARREDTVDGHELTWQVNHLAPFLLTHLLADRLGTGTRVVTTASTAHRAGSIDLTDPDFRRRRWNPFRSYCASKLANVVFTRELATRLRATGVVATCFHPGTVRSDFGRSYAAYRLVRRLPWFITAERAGGMLVALAAEDTGLASSGGYFAGGRPARPTMRGGADLPRRLWEYSLAEVT